jgi:cytosine/adenosine deaminase-related metal-dependent hydrolase
MIVNNVDLVTHWPSQPLLSGALVAIEGKTVVDIGPVGKLVSRYDDEEVLDVSGRLVIPGMVDAGTRLYRSLAAGLEMEWRESHRIEAALDEQSLYWSALAGLLDALRSGVTSVFAAVSAPACIEGSLSAVARAVFDAGVRAALSYLVSPRSDADSSMGENARHLATCRGPSSERIQGMFGLDATSELDEALLRRFAEAAAAESAPCYVALEESRNDPTPAKRLVRAGIWSHGGVALYRGPIPSEDEEALRDNNVFVAHAAEADILSGAGAPDLSRAASSGVRLAMATNGCGASIADALRMASYRQRTRGRAMSDAIRLACNAAFTGGADLATRVFGPAIGRIKPGARADLVVLDYRPQTPIDEDNLPEQLFWDAARAPVRAVIVNGKLLYHNGRFADLDEERIRARAREAAGRIRERL